MTSTRQPKSKPRLPHPLVSLAVAAVVGLGIWFYVERVHDDLFPKRFHPVVEGKIYRSGELTPAAMTTVVRRHGIRTIVDFGADERGSKEDALHQRTAESLGVVRYRFDLYGDATGNPNAYVHALRIMTDPSMQPVLVHCGAGTERTGCVVILYRHEVEGVPIAEAYREATRVGHRAHRNPRLMEVLDRWSGPIIEAWRSGGQINAEGAKPLPEPEPVGRRLSSAG